MYDFISQQMQMQGTLRSLFCVESSRSICKWVWGSRLIPYLATRRDRASRTTSCIVRIFSPMILCLVGGGENARANISPCSIVERFLLESTSLQPRKISSR